MTFLRSGRVLPSKQDVSRREKIGAGFRIGTSLLLSGISSCFSWIAWYSVPYRTFRTGTLSCSEGKGHTFESCRVHQFVLFAARCACPHQTVTPSRSRQVSNPKRKSGVRFAQKRFLDIL